MFRMPVDPDLINALIEALKADPGRLSVRTHLAQLWLEVPDFAEAMHHAELVLSKEPANVDALRVAAVAAIELGDPRATSWNQLLEALSSSATKEATEAQDSHEADGRVRG